MDTHSVWNGVASTELAPFCAAVLYGLVTTGATVLWDLDAYQMRNGSSHEMSNICCSRVIRFGDQRAAILWDLDTSSVHNANSHVRLVPFCVAVLYDLAICFTDSSASERIVIRKLAVVRGVRDRRSMNFKRKLKKSENNMKKTCPTEVEWP